MVIEFLKKRLRKKTKLLINANARINALTTELTYFKQRNKDIREENYHLRNALKEAISKKSETEKHEI
jgi:cell division protein FtsB